MTDTAILSVWDLLYQVITDGSDTPLAPNNAEILGTPRVFRGEAPADREIIDPVTHRLQGYYILGIAPEQEAGYYSEGPGQEGLYRIHPWADIPTNAVRLAKWLKQLIHDRTLELAGHLMITGEVTSIDGPFRDPDGKGWQAPVTYRVESLEAP